jgi:hypothetical protein
MALGIFPARQKPGGGSGVLSRFALCSREPRDNFKARTREGYHRKAAIRALRAKPTPAGFPAVRCGRPKAYDVGRLLPVLKPIWFASQQPFGSRLHALLPEWVPAYEADHREGALF